MKIISDKKMYLFIKLLKEYKKVRPMETQKENIQSKIDLLNDLMINGLDKTIDRYSVKLDAMIKKYGNGGTQNGND